MHSDELKKPEASLRQPADILRIGSASGGPAKRTGFPLLPSYFLAWFGMMAIAVVNGAVRDLAYKSEIGERAAHQLSTLTLVILFGVFFRFLAKHRPISSSAKAWAVGCLWLAMTLAFEFGFGHFVAGHSWQHLLQDYNLAAGRVWVFIPLWVLTGPYLFFRWSRRPSHSSLD